MKAARPSSLRVGTLALAFMLAVGVLAANSASAGPVDPKDPAPSFKYSVSRYVQRGDPSSCWEWGKWAGINTSRGSRPLHQLTILDFGAQTRVYNAAGTLVWGATLFSGRDRTEEEIITCGLNYGEAFYRFGQRASTLDLVMGTNDSIASSATYDWGYRWGELVDGLNTRLYLAGVNSRITAQGGNDIEWGPPSWPTHPANVEQWEEGFGDGAHGHWIMYNYGGAAGCPEGVTTKKDPSAAEAAVSGSCPVTSKTDSTWTQEDYYSVSWGPAVAWPFPEIYNTCGSQAWQWERIALYGIYSQPARTDSMQFSVELTQEGALRTQTGLSMDEDQVLAGEYAPSAEDVSLGVGVPVGLTTASCGGTDNSPAEGFGQLQTALDSRKETRGQTLKFASDIMWTKQD